MNLTFEGFLKGYCRELSGLDTSSLRKLCAAANGEAPRVAEPLFLYAHAQGKLDYLLRLCAGTWMEDPYAQLAAMLPEGASTQELADGGLLPERYHDVFRAYQAKKEGAAAERRVSALMREKALDGLARTGKTCYRLCKDLGLNKGNVYAYLHKGDASKVSLGTARKIMEYACTPSFPS